MTLGGRATLGGLGGDVVGLAVTTTGTVVTVVTVEAGFVASVGGGPVVTTAGCGSAIVVVGGLIVVVGGLTVVVGVREVVVASRCTSVVVLALDTEPAGSSSDALLQRYTGNTPNTAAPTTKAAAFAMSDVGGGRSLSFVMSPHPNVVSLGAKLRCA